MITRTGLIIGLLAGLLVTAGVTMAWPKKSRWAGPLVGPILGVGVALLLMWLIK